MCVLNKIPELLEDEEPFIIVDGITEKRSIFQSIHHGFCMIMNYLKDNNIHFI